MRLNVDFLKLISAEIAVNVGRFHLPIVCMKSNLSEFAKWDWYQKGVDENKIISSIDMESILHNTTVFSKQENVKCK